MAAGRAWLAPRSGPCSAAPLPAPRAPAGTRFPLVTLLHGPVRGAAGLAARQTGGRVSAPLLTGTQSWGCCLSSLSLGFPLALQIFDDYNALPPSRAFEGPQRAGPRGALSKTLASSPIPHPPFSLLPSLPPLVFRSCVRASRGPRPLTGAVTSCSPGRSWRELSPQRFERPSLPLTERPGPAAGEPSAAAGFLPCGPAFWPRPVCLFWGRKSPGGFGLGHTALERPRGWQASPQASPALVSSSLSGGPQDRLAGPPLPTTAHSFPWGFLPSGSSCRTKIAWSFFPSPFRFAPSQRRFSGCVSKMHLRQERRGIKILRRRKSRAFVTDQK